MQIKRFFFPLLLFLCLLLILTACERNGKEMNLNADNVEKIDVLFLLWHEMTDDAELVRIEVQEQNGETYVEYFEIVKTFTDETHISHLIDFFNSLILTFREVSPADTRPSTKIFVTSIRLSDVLRITYHDGTTDFIYFNSAYLWFNDLCFKVGDDDNDFAYAWGKTMELDNLLYGDFDETK